MSKKRSQQRPGGCAQEIVDLTDDGPGGNDAQTPTGPAREEASYICSQCGINLNTYAKFTKHQDMHTTVLLYECPECGQRCTSLTSLSLHQRKHAMKTVYKCTECDKSFIYRSHLMEHQRSHAEATLGSVKGVLSTAPALLSTAPDMHTFQWSMEEKREIMYCYYYASALLPEGYMQLLRTKLEQRGILPLTKLQCASDAKLRCVIYQVNSRHYINDANLEQLKNAAKEEIAAEI